MGIGKAVVVFPQADLTAVPERKIDNVEDEIKAFETALSKARSDIEALQARSKEFSQLQKMPSLMLICVFRRSVADE